MDANKIGGLFSKKSMRIAIVVVVCWFVSISLVFVNKALLSGKELKLNAPLFIVWFQCFFTVVSYLVITLIVKPFSSRVQFPELGFQYDTILKVLPLSIYFVGMISFSSLCLKYVDLSFYYIGKCLSTVFNVALSWIILGERTSVPSIICCIVITGGFLMGVKQEGTAGSLSILGTVYGMIAAIFVALNAIYTKRVLPSVDQSVWLLGYYNNLNACILFLPLMLLNGEYSTIVKSQSVTSVSFWMLMFFGGLLGFAVSYIQGLQIRITSALTHNVSGTAQASIQTILAVQWYHQVKPWLWWISNAIVLMGSAAYSRIRLMGMEASTNKECNV